MTVIGSNPPAYGFRSPRRSALRIPRQDFICFSYSFLVAFLCQANGVMNAVSAASLFLLGLAGPFFFGHDMLRNGRARIGLIFPGVALLSVIWSNYPGTTLYYSIQLFLTYLVAVSLASVSRLGVSIRGLFYAHLVFAAISIPLGQSVLWEDGNYVFVGLSVAKNNYGGMNALLVLLGVYVLHAGLTGRRRLDLMAGAGGILLGFVGVLLSKSTGSLISSVSTILVYVMFATLSAFRRETRLLIVAIFAVMVLVLGLIVLGLWSEISGPLLAYFGKSSDLTGRVDLWFIADRLIEQHYWLGAGQFAFWVPGNPAAEALWAEFLITGKRGFNFHNSYREIMVHLGMVGLVVYAVAFVTLFATQLRDVLVRPRKEQFLYLIVLISAAKSAPVESLAPFSPANTGTIFILTGLLVRSSASTGRRAAGVSPRGAYTATPPLAAERGETGAGRQIPPREAFEGL